MRDNKESGPYSEEEMIAKGFKPYDLIWVEGKSAGWRYPGEIPAFKSFAPMVEEQPYDRFYKKQPPQKHFVREEKTSQPAYSAPVAKTAVPAAKENILPEISIQQQPKAVPMQAPDYNIRSLPGRHIHVTLPSGNTINLTTLAGKTETKEAVEKPTAAAASAMSAPVKPGGLPVTTKPAVMETAAPVFAKEIKDKHHVSRQPIPEEQPVIVMPAASYQPIAGFSWSLIAASFIGIATLVGLGIMIGLAMNREKNDKAFNESLRIKSKQTHVVPDNSTATLPAANNLQDAATGPVVDESLQPSAGAGKELVQNAVVKSNVLPFNERRENKFGSEEKASAEQKKPSEKNEEPLAHNRPVSPSVNIEKNLLVTPNDFKTGAFGGISGLKCTLFNGSKLPLESVEVEVDYIQANNKIFKTERLLFKEIGAGSQATLDAPPSTRGIKINSRIIKINTKETGLSNTTAKS